ncbi:hypothetical protein AD948_10150 [Acetobacter senegalensis]|uniref:Uncharacterized protein n=1 Tax=Acetobacter senegalensis TaxID=446692 RepID=A0A149U086_9PROT|nr:hypothetical protein AD948_10150 [Acetobacter senegalensis]
MNIHMGKGARRGIGTAPMYVARRPASLAGWPCLPRTRFLRQSNAKLAGCVMVGALYQITQITAV